MRQLAMALLGLSAMALVACGDSKVLPFEPGAEEPDPSATFARVQNEVFTPSCARAGCHAGAAPQAGLDLSDGRAYASTVGVPAAQRSGLARVDPGDAERSYLVKKVRGDADIAGSPMPPTGALPAERVKLVVDWVRRGAPND